MEAKFTPPTLGSETIFHLGVFEVRNTLIASFMAIFVLLVIGLILRKQKYALVPSGFQSVVEMVIGGFYDFFGNIVHGEKKLDKIFPIAMTIFLFVIVSNWMGLLPGFGSIGFFEEHHGHTVLVPFFRSTFADVNMTLALALISISSIQVLSISFLGAKTYLGKFFVNPLKNPVGTFIGLLELLSEVSKMISFSFRLYGNLFAGEVLLLVISFLVPFIAPLPFYGLEVFVGFVQALVFSFLTIVFFSIASSEHH
ncbi:MAG: FoF1 ATP synthase subunit a [Candidatus Gracilibacteria bacterium]|jgi:F-type H+-transporting ATPase subunit a|nr:FoF1 ATP synthase subunit a [Candidatus Gracilibacteria bacterium]